MAGIVEEIYIARKGSVQMEKVEEIQALEGCGLEGDRYCEGTGYWTPYGDVCEVTMISAEDLDYIERELGLHVNNGEHRRNLIVRGMDLSELRGRRFRIGDAILQYDRPRPPCRHIQDLTEPGMTRALRRRGGHCVRVLEGGMIRPRNEIEILQVASSK